MIRFFTLLAISIITLGQGFAQNYVNYDRDTRWFIGINAGATWTTQTEVPYRLRGGYGLTFGKSFGMEPDKIFSWDLRARFLHAQFMGQSTTRYALDSSSVIGLDSYGPSTIQTYQDSLGYFYSNYRTNLLRGSIELVLNTNRLRQRTGWNLSVFGGIGITGYHTAADLINSDNTLNGPTYDYDNLSSATTSNLLDFQDGNYETDVVGDINNYEVDWMPSFGFGISKQVLPGIAIGLEHKMTWTRTNMFDGMPNNLDGTSSLLNDKYHYTALTVKFHLYNGKRVDNDHKDDVVDDVNIDDFDTNTNPPIIDDPVSKKKPIVDIYDPSTSPYTTTQSSFKLKANIYYVENRSGVTFKQDGNLNTNFSFNPSTDQFESTVILHPGQNLFEITGVNEAGSDYEAVIIIYQKEEEPRNPPIVTITNPPYTPFTTTSSIFGLVSTVLNVDSKSQIQVYVNGVSLTTFSYDLTSKGLNASLNLKEGTNSVTVTASNEVGSDSKTVQIIYKKPETLQPPVVTFVNPGVDPYYTNVNTINIRATALNVATKSDVTVLVNGNPVSSFSFNTTTKEVYFSTGLLEGANFVEITGVNTAGSDSETTTIIYTRPETPRPPIVTFIDPASNPITVYTNSYNVTAKVEYVGSASDITLKINGIVTTLFYYSTSSDLMRFTTGLVEGSNVIEIKGVNEYGSDVKTTTIIYKRNIPQAPPIVNITYPAVDNVEFGSPNITLEASVLNVASASDITVWVNGVTTGAFTYNTYTKGLTLPLVLLEGSNVVKISGTNVAGTDSKTRIIIYKKPIVPSPPTVNFINPPTSPYLVDVASYTVTANTTHIDSKSQIVLKQNGILISTGAYSFVGNQIIYPATLISGSNIFEVAVENPDGSDEDIAIINYERNVEPCIIPTVGYISPVPYSTVDNPNVTIDAQINNHSVGTTVELRLNGMSKGYMTYNAGTSIASKALVLNEGSNAITVIVTNACGTNQATFTLNYNAPDAPCFDPVLTASGTTTYSTLEEVVSFTVSSSNVSATDDLDVKLNGTTIPHTFDAGTGTITVSGINLNVGSNSVVVTAKTACGTAILVYTITRNVCLAPVISAVSPITGTSTEASSIVLTANVSNATAAEIVVLLNGVSQAFTYNPVTGALSQAMSIGIGSNTLSIQVTNACGTSSKSVTITRTIPCETIVTNLLSPATGTVTVTDPSYLLSLHASGLTSAEQIIAKLNGTAVPALFDAVSGNITLSGLSLADGENTITVDMTNACSKATVSYKVTYNGCKAPVIIFNSVYPGMVVTESVFSLGVVVTNVASASDLILKVNGTSVDFDFDPASHLLTANFPLLEGGNTIEVLANGCEDVSASASLTYEKPCVGITHTLVSPISTTVTALESTYAISLSTFGVVSADQIGVKLNGATIPFNFNAGTKIITINSISLIDGTNNVVVTLTNDCSSEVINYRISYDGCEPPVITLGSNSTAVTTAAYSFEANISNVAGSGSIQFLLNGAPSTFVYDPISGGLDANLTLAVGENTIRIIANGCETVTQDFVVNYTIPCSPITYTLVHPTGLTASEAGGTYSIILAVNNVTAAGISVSKLGVSLPFTYADNMLTINGISLADGVNAVVVSLKNECSSEKITYNITHDDCHTPLINLGGNPLSIESATYDFNAKVTYIESADQIQLKLNGAIKPFTFDPVTGKIKATLTLIEGANTIQLIANGCTAASDMIRVTYSIPCAPVTYGLVSPAILVSASSEESISISLNASNVQTETVSVILNGTPIAFTYAGGVISIPSVALIEGANTVVVTFGNTCSSETVTYTINHAHCEAPSVVINGLTDGMVLVEQELVFFASIFNVDDAGDIIVRFNGVAVPFEFNPITKLLQVPLSLTDGSNTIEVIVSGCETVTSGLTLDYDEPCAAPTYTRVSPATSGVTVDGDSFTITLTTTNVTEDQVSVKVNGGSFPFTFSAGTVIITVPYITVPTNSIVVTLTNDCGTTTANYSVTYVLEEEDCTPIVSAVFGADNRSVTATSNKDLLNVILNLDDGTTQLLEDVSGKTGTFSPIGEKEGRCITGVWIRSGCNLSAAGEPFGDYVANPGWDGRCVIEVPCSPITYSLITPTRLSASATIGTYSIIFTATNLSGAEDVLALVNGVPKTVVVSGSRVTLAGIILNPGSNTIQFTLTNACSTQSLTYTISYTPPTDGGRDGSGGIDKLDGGGTTDGGGVRTQLAPEIIPISPTSTKTTVKNQVLNFKTKVTNVSSKSEIELTVNGVKNLNFTYNSTTQQMAAAISLNAGVNMIKVVASNGSKKELTYYITYEKEVSGPPVDNGGINQGGNNQQVVTLAPELIRVSPSTSTATSDNATYLLKVNTVNVMSKADLTLNVNGVNITNFTFSSSTKQMSAAIQLNEGANTIRVDAKNADKRASLSYTITYKKATQIGGSLEQGNGGKTDDSGSLKQVEVKPIIKNVNPIGTTATVKTPTFVLKTNIANVAAKGDISLTVNGAVVSNFTFNPVSGALVATLTLKAGQNAIRITAKNGNQVATVSYTITYQAAQSPVKVGGGIEDNNGGSPATNGGELRQGTGGVRR